MTLKKFIGRFDLFKRPLFLRVAKQQMVSTNCGFFLSFVIYVCLGGFLFQSDFFLKTNPKILIETSQFSNAPSIFYNKKPLAFSLKDNTGNVYYDEKYFKINVNLVKTSMNDTGSTSINIEPKSYHICSSENKTHNGFCLNDTTFILEGSLGDYSTSVLQIEVHMCENSSLNNNTCKSSNEIQDYLVTKSLHLNFHNTIFQLKSYSTPTVESMFRSVYKLDTRVNGLVTINLQKAFLMTDETTFYRNLSQIEDFVFEKENIDIGPLTSIKDPILSVVFLSSKNVISAQRSYQTLAQAFAELGGLFSFLIAIGSVLHKIDNSIFLTTVLMNFLYSFQQAPKKLKSNMKDSKFPLLKQLSNTKIVANLEIIAKQKEQENKSEEENSRIDENLEYNPEFSSISPGLDKNSFHEIINLEKYNGKEMFPSFGQSTLCEISKKITKHESDLKIISTIKEEVNSSPQMAKNLIQSEKIKKKILEDDSMTIPSPKEATNEKSPPNFKKNSPHFSFVPLEVEKGESQTIKLKEKVKQINPQLSPSERISNFFKRISVYKTTKKDKKKSLEDFVKFNEKTNRISFNVFDFMKLTIKKLMKLGLNFNEKLFVRAHEVFEKEIDIVKILQRVQDIDKLKYILLNEQQRTLFDVLEKPMVFVDNDHHLDQAKSSAFLRCAPKKETDVNLKITKAFQYYQELEKNKSNNPIDNKLFSLIHSRFETYKKYFENI